MALAFILAGKAKHLALALVPACWLAVSSACAASFPIDIDPSSPTLGDILDAERPKRRRSVSPSPRPEAPPKAQPTPQRATTVPAPRPANVPPREARKPAPAITVAPPPSVSTEPTMARPAASEPASAPPVQAAPVTVVPPRVVLPNPTIVARPVPQKPSRSEITGSSAKAAVPAAEQQVLPPQVLPSPAQPERASRALETPARSASTLRDPSPAPPVAPKAVPAAPVRNEAVPAAPGESKPAHPAAVVPVAEPTPTATPTVAPAGAEPERFVFVVDQDLRQFLTDFARRVGLRSDVASTVRGRLTKVKLPTEPMALMRDLEKRFDLEWLIEGEILKVSSRAELATRIMPLGTIAYAELLRELKAVDIDTTRYPLRKLAESNAVITTAPATHVARVSAIIDALRAGKGVGPELRVIRGGRSGKVEWD